MKIKEKRKFFIKAIFITILFLLFLFIMQKNIKAVSILEQNEEIEFIPRSGYEKLTKTNNFVIKGTIVNNNVVGAINVKDFHSAKYINSSEIRYVIKTDEFIVPGYSWNQDVIIRVNDSVQTNCEIAVQTLDYR